MLLCVPVLLCYIHHVHHYILQVDNTQLIKSQSSVTNLYDPLTVLALTGM